MSYEYNTVKLSNGKTITQPSKTTRKSARRNALASKNAAALSAESAEADRVAAEAARDEAQDLANVGYVSEGHAGLAVDERPRRPTRGGVDHRERWAIGDLGDLASAQKRGRLETIVTTASDLNAIYPHPATLFTRMQPQEKILKMGWMVEKLTDAIAKHRGSDFLLNMGTAGPISR